VDVTSGPYGIARELRTQARGQGFEVITAMSEVRGTVRPLFTSVACPVRRRHGNARAKSRLQTIGVSANLPGLPQPLASSSADRQPDLDQVCADIAPALTACGLEAKRVDGFVADVKGCG
jgi:hypothetical protein